jgi:flagellar basal-body rod protein FlgB
MIDQILESTQVLQKALEGTRARHTAILQNIANIETPGYKRKVVRFEDDLREALSGSGGCEDRETAAALRSIHPKVEVDDESVIRADGNTVDVDQESSELAQNTLRYIALLEAINRQFRGLKHVMTASV